MMERTIGTSLDGMGILQHRSVAHEPDNWTVVHRDRTGCDGYDLWLPWGDAPILWSRWLEEARISPVGHEALNWLRTEAGIPWYGIDMDENSLPQELGLSSAISLTKGCYRGQEIVARVHYRGHLGRQLGAVVIQFDRPPAKGAEVRANGDRIGEVTSSIPSPRLGRPLALCILKSAYLSASTVVEVAYDDCYHTGEVLSLPLGTQTSSTTQTPKPAK
jgi:aminomethyltransferase